MSRDVEILLLPTAIGKNKSTVFVNIYDVKLVWSSLFQGATTTDCIALLLKKLRSYRLKMFERSSHVLQALKSENKLLWKNLVSHPVTVQIINNKVDA